MTWISRRRAALRRDEGASAVEYGLLVAAIAAIVVTVVFAIGRFVQAGFNEACDNIDDTTASTGGFNPECDPAP